MARKYEQRVILEPRGPGFFGIIGRIFLVIIILAIIVAVL